MIFRKSLFFTVMSLLMTLNVFACSMTPSPQSRAVTKGPSLMVFVSTSMPKESLKKLIGDTQKAGGTVFIRGLINNQFKDTIAFFKSMNAGVQLDPPLFDQYAIKVVPTIIVEKEGVIDQIAGQVTLSYALQTFHDQGETGKTPFLKALKGTPQ